MFASAVDRIKGVKLGEKAEVKSDDGWGSKFAFNEAVTATDLRDMVEKDAQVKAAIMLKILARTSSGWTIEPASDDALDVEIAEYVEAQLSGIPGTMDGFLRRAMMALPYRTSVHEIVYEYIETGRWAGRVGLKALKVKRPEKFELETDKFGNLTGLKMKKGLNDSVTLDPEYFVLWAYAHEGDYQGKSDLRAAYRWWKTKDFIGRMWNIWIERYASPVPVAKYPPSTDPKDKAKLAEFLQTIHSRKSVVVPKEWEVELLESARDGGDFELSMRYCDRMIARSILLPNLLLDEGSSGAYALGKVHAETFRWVLDALGKEIEHDIVGDQIIRRLVDLNFQDVEVYPQFKFHQIVPANFSELTKAIVELVNAGVLEKDEPVIRKRLGLPARETTDPEPGGAADSGSKAGDSQGGAPVEKETPSFAYPDQPGLDGLAHAGKCDFAEIAKGLDGIEQEAVATMASVVQQMHASIKSTLRSKKIVEKSDRQAVNKLQLPGVGDLRRSLAAAMGHAVQQGSFDMFGEVSRGLSQAGQAAPKPLRGSVGRNFDDGEAAEFGVEDVIGAWEKRTVIQRHLLAEYSQQAFTVSGVLRDDLLNSTKMAIHRGMTRGATFAQIEQEINAIFEPYYGAEVDAAVGTASRLQTIVRTNVASAYNSGRMALYRHPEVVGFVKGFEYSAVLDTRTTPFCREYHGKTLKEGDSRLQSIVPPNHHQCRSVLIPVVIGEEFTPSPRLPGIAPSKGFGI